LYAFKLHIQSSVSILLTGSADQRGNVWGDFLRNVGSGEAKWRIEKQTTESKVRKVAWGFRFGYGPSSVWHHCFSH